MKFDNKKVLFSAILTIAILSVSTALVSANNDNTVYVSPTGNDGNIGTSDSPFKTIAKAVEVAPEGGTVFIKAGTYLAREGNANMVITKDLTIKGEDKKTTIIDGSGLAGTRDPNHGNGLSIYTEGAIFTFGSYENVAPIVKIQGLTFKNQPSSAYLPINIRSETKGLPEDVAGPENCIKDCNFVNNCKGSIDSSASNLKLLDCDFTNNSGVKSLESGGYLTTIINCKFIDNSGVRSGGILLDSNAKYATINNSLFSGNIGSPGPFHCPDYGNDIANELGCNGVLRVNNCIFTPSSTQNDAPSIYVGEYNPRTIIDGVEQ